MTAVAPAPIVAGEPATLQTLQLGMEWFGEKAGGLNRVYGHLINELARSGGFAAQRAAQLDHSSRSYDGHVEHAGRVAPSLR